MVADLERVLQDAGVEPDPRAGRAFRRAAAAMAMTGDAEDRRRWGREAVDAIVGLASARRDAELRALLTPDPVNQNVTWTVACYQVGDLAPSAVRDFASPSDAVATLAACPDGSHVAAELVASTQLGLRWTAMVRTNDVRQFQLPSAETASDASHEHGAELADALRRWRRRLTRWAERAGGPTRPTAIDAGRAPDAIDRYDDDDIDDGPPPPPRRRPAARRRLVEVDPGDDDRYDDEDDDIDDGPRRAVARRRRPSGLAEATALNRRLTRLEDAITALAGAMHEQVERSDRLETAVLATQRSMAAWAEPLNQLVAAVESVDRGLTGLALLRGELHGVGDRTETVRRTVQAGSDAVAGAIETHHATVDRRLGELESQVGDSGRATADALRHVATSLAQVGTGIETRQRDAVRHLDDVLVRVATALTETGGSLDEIPRKVDAAVGMSLQALGMGLAQRLDTATARSSTALGLAIDGRAGELERRLGEIGADMARRLDEIAEGVARGLDERAGALVQRLDDIGTRVEASLDQRAGAMEQRLDERTGAMEQRLDEIGTRVEQAATSVAGDLATRTARLETLVARTTHVLGRSIDEHLARLDDVVAGIDTAIARRVDEQTAVLQLELQGALTAVVAAPDRGAVLDAVAALRAELLG